MTSFAGRKAADQDIVLVGAAIVLAGLAMSTGQLWLTGVAVGLSASILAVQAWVNFIRPAIRKRKMKSPYSVSFKLGLSGDAPTAQELTVPAYSEAQIDLRILSHLSYAEHEITVGFEGQEDERPLIRYVSQKFVKVGLLKKRVPGIDEGHYVDYNDNYHIKTRAERLAGRHSALGFMVKTRKPGRYPISVEVATDAGEACSRNKPILIVEAKPKRKPPKPPKRPQRRSFPKAAS